MKKYNIYNPCAVKFNNFRHMLALAVESAGSSDAFLYSSPLKSTETVSVSYRGFADDVKALACALYGQNAYSGTCAIVGENSYEWINVYYSSLCSDGVFVPIDKELPIDEIANILAHSSAQTLFFTLPYLEKIKSRIDLFSGVRLFVCIGLCENGEIGERPLFAFDSFLKQGKELASSGLDPFPPVDSPASGSLKMLVYTSGTTGTPKGVMLSEKNLVSCVYGAQRVITLGSRCLSVLPYHHTYPAVCDLLLALHNHTTICINESLRTFGSNLLKYKPDYIMTVPLFLENLYKRIMKSLDDKGKTRAFALLLSTSRHSRKIGIDIRKSAFASIRALLGGNLKKIICGGAPLRAELADFFEAVGIDVINGYGITECSPLVAVNREYANDPHSVGEKLECCEFIIDSPNEAGEGEVLVKGGIVMMGYYNNKEETEKAFTPDGWFKTGDYGKADSNGRLYITGRKKNIIVLKNGKNIYPEEIEQYILSNLRSVCEVVVSAVKNAEGEEVGLCAEIYPDGEVRTLMDKNEQKMYFKEQIEKMNQNIPSYKNIAKVKIRGSEFPKTTTNKIKREY